MPERAVVVLSGGQDSTTCLYDAKNRGYEIHAITFDYGQRHKREIEAARHVAELCGVASHEVIQLGSILKGSSPLVSNNELEQYEDFHSLPGGLEKTFVPMRNMLFLTIAANRAYVLGAQRIFTGVCQEDYGGYPDCRMDFIDAFTLTAREATDHDFIVETPLMFMTKAESIEFALTLPGCYEALAYTHTSYDGKYPPTGKDHATLLREKGFFEAGVPDPLVVRAWYEAEMVMPSTDNYGKGDEYHPYIDRITDFLDKVKV